VQSFKGVSMLIITNIIICDVCVCLCVSFLLFDHGPLMVPQNSQQCLQINE